MELGYIIMTFVAVAIAFILGYLVGLAKNNIDVKGTVHIVVDECDANMYPYLAPTVPMEELATMSKAAFIIKTIRQDSHK
jgi:hypothetical protein